MSADPTPPPPSIHASTSPSRILRNSNFRKLWIGAMASSAGTAIGSIVITWVVYTATYNPLAISLLGIVQFLPTLAFGLLAGALIDRWDRRRLMVSCDAARAVCFGSLALWVLWKGVDVAAVIGVVFVVAVFGTIFRPATNATIPRILPKADTTDGNGVLQGGTTVAQFVGSPVGGLLLVAVGAVVGLAINALTFAISGTLIALMAIPAGAPKAASATDGRRSLLHEVREGLQYLRSQPALLNITLCAMAANFFLSIWGGFQVIYAAEALRQGATGFGILVAANTAGFSLGAILPGRLHTERSPGPWVIAAWGPVGFFLVALAFTRSLWVAAALSLGAGILLSMGNTTWLSGVQRTVPDELLGRYLATDEAGSFAAIPASLAVGGVLVLAIGIDGAYLLAGIGALLANVPMILSRSVRTWGASPRAGPTEPR